MTTLQSADPGGQVFEGVGLRPLACRDCEFESRRGHGYLSCECCALSGALSLRRVDNSSKGDLSSACLRVIVNPRQRGGFGPLAAVELLGGGRTLECIV